MRRNRTIFAEHKPRRTGRLIYPLFLLLILALSIGLNFINNGRVLKNGLRDKGLDEAWLTRAVREHGFRDTHEVLLLTIDGAGKVLCVGKEEGR